MFCAMPRTLDIYPMLDLPSIISRLVRSEIARIRFSFEEGLRLVSNDERIEILSDANLASLRNIDEIDDGSEASMSELIATLSCLLVGVVCFQSCTPA